ncbi:thiamine pyrophosphate-dependent dehydrogenase E1 component subunit alpha [Symbiobacterium terraclitae]|uniref:thiamine pyrophosphate-dependent dehydrogenase E1 component subunit alpha n=1 Tax=Symbiobacterium terraclitae TaxID=557451 RepID=UPI0035B52068
MMEATTARHEALGLTRDQMVEMYYYMLLTRRLDERLWLLQRGGKIPFVISPQGQEAAQVGAAFAFRKRQDWFAPYYRDLGINLVAGVTPREVMLSAFARGADPASGGKQMPSHWGHRALNIVSGSSPVTTQMLHAVGIAQAARMRGDDVVVYTACGEGSSNQGDFHEALNWAGVHKLPVIFMVQNNEYAISVPLTRQVAGGSVAARGQGYGMPGIEVDGTDVLAVYEVVKAAHERARRGEGPTLIEARCIRITSHSSDDDQRRYRDPEEIAAVLARDPIVKARHYLREHGLLDEAGEQELERRVMAAVDDATDWAEAQPYAAPEEALRHVYKEG